MRLILKVAALQGGDVAGGEPGDAFARGGRCGDCGHAGAFTVVSGAGLASASSGMSTKSGRPRPLYRAARNHLPASAELSHSVPCLSWTIRPCQAASPAAVISRSPSLLTIP